MSFDYSMIEPIGDRIVVKRDVTKSRTEGGIELPEQAKTVSRWGAVVAAGPGNHRIMPSDDWSDRLPMQCKVGNRVLLPSMAEIIKLDDTDPDSAVTIISESQVLFILHT